MNISKWFIKSNEIFLIKNFYLLNITSNILNDIETDENNNYWKYHSFEKIREYILNKYQISQNTFLVLYTKEKLMMASSICLAFVLDWI